MLSKTFTFIKTSFLTTFSIWLTRMSSSIHTSILSSCCAYLASPWATWFPFLVTPHVWIPTQCYFGVHVPPLSCLHSEFVANIVLKESDSKMGRWLRICLTHFQKWQLSLQPELPLRQHREPSSFLRTNIQIEI